MRYVLPITSRCSVSSVVVAPGPCVKTEPRPKYDLHTAETLHEPQEHLKTRAAPSLNALVPAEGQRRSNDTFSDGCWHAVGNHQQLCRQNSLTFRSWRASLPKTQTAPSSGDCLECLPSRGKCVDFAGLMISENTSGSLSHSHNGETHQRDDPQQMVYSSVFATMQDGNTVQDKQEDSISAPNSSPVRTIQRRVRVYERKRRKLETQPCNISDDFRLKLLEIFQSSDDTNVEFLGFES